MSSRNLSPFPRSVSILKIVQTVLSVFVLGLTAYLEAYYPGDYQIILPLAVVSSC